MIDAKDQSLADERAKRAAYMRGYRHSRRHKQKPPDSSIALDAEPSLSLDVLASLDFSDPRNVSVLRRGLMRAIADGSILANAASQLMRFAEAEAAAAPKRRAAVDDQLLSRLRGGREGGNGERERKNQAAFTPTEAEVAEPESRATEGESGGSSPAATEG